MNILMLGLDLNPPWIEGIRNSVRDISIELVKRGHNVFFLTKGMVYHKLYEVIDGITYYRILSGKNYESAKYLSGYTSYLPKLFVYLPKVIKKEKIDVVHAHSSYPIFGFLSSVAGKYSDVLNVFSLYSSISKAPPFSYKSIVQKALDISRRNFWISLSNLDVIIAKSKRVYSILSSIAQTSTFKTYTYVPVPINFKKFLPTYKTNETLRDELGIPKSRKIILFGGDLTPYKGAEVFIYALSQVKRSYDKIHGIILAKKIYERAEIRSVQLTNLAKRLGVLSRITFVGTRDDIEDIFNLADIVVFPFLKDYAVMDVPRALLEAMACAKPVIASNVGGIQEVVRHMRNGILISPRDYVALSEYMLMLLTNPSLAKELGDNAYKFVRTKYSSENIVTMVERIYKKGLSR